MKQSTGVLTFLFLLFSSLGYSQQDSLIKKLDSLSDKADTTKQVNDIEPAAYTETTQITFRNYFVLLGSNLKQQVTGPFHASKKSWKQVGALALMTGALAFADMPIQKEALKFRNSSKAVQDVSGFITDFGGLYEGYTLAAFGAYGFIFKNEKMKTTTLLATQAYITGGVVGTLVKYITAANDRVIMAPIRLKHVQLFTGHSQKQDDNTMEKQSVAPFPRGTLR